MQLERLPVDAIAAAILGALLGALFVLLDGSRDAAADVAAGGITFGSLGLVRWINRLSDLRKRDLRDPLV